MNVESFDFADIAPNNPNHVNLSDVPKYVMIDTLLGKPYHAKVYAFFIPRIPANSSKMVRVVVKCTAQKVMHMRAWVNPPWYGSPLKYAVGECWDNLISLVAGNIPFGVGCAYNTISLVTSPIFDYAYDVNFDENYAQDFFENAAITGVGCASDVVSGGMAGFILNVTSLALNYTSVPGILKSCSPPEDKEDKEVNSIGATDPNDKSGPTGQGAEGWINTKQKFSYLIRFENKASATAPARKVIVRDTLNKTIFDLNTLDLKGFSIADKFFPLAPGNLNDSIIFDLRPSIPSLVKVQTSLNKTNGELTWIFTALDTLTKKEPTDVRAGFLPPDVDSIIGQAAVLYDIHVLENIQNGTKIKNRAVIYFDFNNPVFTNTWQLTADNRVPESNVRVLADTMKSTKFTLNWSGSDVGSGIRYYNVYYQKDDGYWLRAISSTNKTSMEFKGEAGSHYKFYSVAVDTAMNQEYAPVNADASTYVSQSALGIENITTYSWKIYPNPATDMITVEYKGSASLSISMYDMSGRLVLQQKLQSSLQNPVTLDINKLSPGIYLLKLSDGKDEKQVKFVKK